MTPINLVGVLAETTFQRSMKMGSESQRRALEHADFVNPAYRWRCASSGDRGESARQKPHARIEMCVARLAELQIESARAAAELTKKDRSTGLRPRELTPERLRLLRKLGALEIERAEIDRELASLNATQRSHTDQAQPPAARQLP